MMARSVSRRARHERRGALVVVADGPEGALDAVLALLVRGHGGVLAVQGL